MRTGTLPDGAPEVHGIVCGAPNFFVGDKVVVGPPCPSGPPQRP
jgi:phenylalanyl-tRNA synthetase beta chain